MTYDPTNGSPPQFATYRPANDGYDAYDGYDALSGKVRFVDHLPGPIYPLEADGIIETKAVHLPSLAAPYSSEADLISEIDTFIRKYLAVGEFFHRLAPYYVLFSWVYDRFRELPYLRAIGGYGAGKSRFLMTIGSLCYRPIFCMGAASMSSIFRLLNALRGTLILDEADFNKSGEAHYIIKMLNTGYQADFPLFRSEATKDGSFEPQSFNVFGPKIIATRKEFTDQALESRCLTERMDGKFRSGIPLNLTDEFWAEATSIRNQLLMWRLLNYHRIKPVQAMGDLRVQPRLAQILLPLTAVISDKQVVDELRHFMRDQDTRLREDRLDTREGKVFKAILDRYAENKASELTIQQITDSVNSSISKDKYKLSNQQVGRTVSRVLELPRERRTDGRYVVLDSDEARKKLKYWADQFGLEWPDGSLPD